MSNTLNIRYFNANYYDVQSVGFCKLSVQYFLLKCVVHDEYHTEYDVVKPITAMCILLGLANFHKLVLAFTAQWIE